MYMKLIDTQLNNTYLAKIKRVPRGLTSKLVSKQELEPYFDVVSVEDLLFTLYQFRENDYLTYDVELSSNLEALAHARERAKRDMSRFKPFEPFGPVGRESYTLMSISGKRVPFDEPLNEIQLQIVLNQLPDDKLERFLKFRLQNIKQKLLREIIAQRPAQSGHKPKIDGRVAVRYKDLVVNGATVTYKLQPITLTPQQRELLRFFIRRAENIISWDEIYGNNDIFDGKTRHNIPTETVDKLVQALHSRLNVLTGECIYNTRKAGWTLKLI